MTNPQLSLVVPTIGRPDMLRRLVRSLEVEAATASFELIVMDQSDDGSARDILAALNPSFEWFVYPHERGASRSKNTGIATARGTYIAFPDDDAWFPGTTLKGVIDVFERDPKLGGVTTMLWDGEGRPNLLRWQSEPGPVTLGNHYRTSIGATCFFRKDVADGVGGFEELVGPGSGTDIGSCCDADYLLRAMAIAPVTYVPSLGVHHDAMIATLEASVAAKMFNYGIGQAWFWRRHRFPRLHIAYLLFRKVVKVAIAIPRRQWVATATDRAFVRGAIHGLRDRDLMRRAGTEVA